jgi:excisionase family DNA binding protein
MRQISRQTNRKETNAKSLTHTRRQSQRSPKAEQRKGKTRPPRKAGGSHLRPSRRTNHGSRHTTNPPVPCLGRSFSADKVCKGRRVRQALATAPSGGRLWHGFAVRTAASRRGREGSDLRSSGKDLGSHPVQSGLSLDREYVRAKASGPTFFTERTLAAYLAVSDRTIRNWIRRGELPSYKLGASRRIDPADVEDFLARHRDAAA